MKKDMIMEIIEKKMAKLILKAYEIRENSFSFDEIDNLEDDCLFIDYTNFYKKSIEQSVYEASEILNIDHKLDYPIYLLLVYNSNEIIIWANKIIKYKLSKKEIKNNFKCLINQNNNLKYI
jgi:hypothetical protein